MPGACDPVVGDHGFEVLSMVKSPGIHERRPKAWKLSFGI
jgi:hypothetical protein